MASTGAAVSVTIPDAPPASDLVVSFDAAIGAFSNANFACTVFFAPALDGVASQHIGVRMSNNSLASVAATRAFSNVSPGTHVVSLNFAGDVLCPIDPSSPIQVVPSTVNFTTTILRR